MNQPYDPNQPQWGQPQTGGQPSQPHQWGAPTGQPYGQQPGYGGAPHWGQQSGYGAPQYGQQGYGPQGAQPWGSPPQQKGNGKLIGLIVGGVVLLAAIGVTLWLVLGSGGGRSVEETIDGYVAAAKANDPEEAKKFTCPQVDSEIDASGDPGYSGGQFDIEVKSVEENGDQATAEVSAVYMGESVDATVQLEKNSDDDWEICEIQVDFGAPSTTTVD
ncbi:hypothetical protein [Blastococcus sp. Marseille-P5729]|uniref:Rv0361 family membrane protein n=1 Tax=Blastococcus sp. Marseille-P5729 TaxID=2086582 RepID=UPI000D10C188|nr:hypothetical protein [Blastococcus sp. Marseille-P5729]